MGARRSEMRCLLCDGWFFGYLSVTNFSLVMLYNGQDREWAVSFRARRLMEYVETEGEREPDELVVTWAKHFSCGWPRIYRKICSC